MVSLSYFLLALLMVFSKDYLLLSSVLDICLSNTFLNFLMILSVMLVFLVKNNFSSENKPLIFFSYHFIIFSSLGACFWSSSPFNFLLFLEICVFPMIFLIYFYSKDLDKVSSLLFMFFLNILGSVPFMLFCGISGLCVFHTNWEFLHYDFLRGASGFMCVILILILKLPIFFAHFWLTKAHVSASGPTSMVLASLMLKLGSIGLLKFKIFSNFIYPKFSNFFLGFSLVSCLVVGFMMFSFFDLKFFVACSSILHASMSFPLSISGGTCGWLSVIMLIMGHGLVSLTLFFILTLMYEFSSSRSSLKLKTQESLSGLFTKWAFIYSFLNLGLPPFINFLSEVFMGMALLSHSLWGILLFCGILLMGLFITITIIFKIIFGKKLEISESLDFSPFNFVWKYLMFFTLFSSFLLS